jgi:hypothetical protein
MYNKYDVLLYTREVQGIQDGDVYEISERNEVEPGGVGKTVNMLNIIYHPS